MRYISTRGEAPALAFDEVLLAGLARDGGLYLPESWPSLSEEELRALAGQPYAEVAFRVMWPFVEGSLAEADFRRILEERSAVFRHEAVAPLKQLEPSLWVQELFHGPTLAFKDVAMQLLGRLFEHVLAERGERVTIVGATSGDTGSAAIEACRGGEHIDIFILHPKGRVSEVQRRQMTTVADANVHNLAVEGTFDDCQDLVKAMFGDAAFRDELRLSAVNSINWARVMAQIVYYVTAALALGAPQRRIAFAVPTGNFGNVFAAYAARRMGLPIAGLVVGSNSNDILTRFFESGRMAISEVMPTYSPSMDIQVSSNFERLLYDALGGDGQAVARTMTEFRKTGAFGLGDNELAGLTGLFSGYSLDNAGTLAEMKRVYEASGEILDPHSAIGVAAARARWSDPAVPVVALATAHPAKFPAAVEKALGIAPALPPSMADLLERPERCESLPNDLAAVQDFVRRGSRAAKETT